MPVGDTFRITVQVRNARDPSVRFESLDPAIASVDGSGLVRGVAVGFTSITVASVQDSEARATVPVRVLPELPGEPGTPSVLIASILQADGQPVDPGAVRGEVTVQSHYRPAGAARLEVLLGERTVCSVGVASASGTVECDIDTAAFDPATGTPVFQNSTMALRVRLVTGSGQVLAQARQEGIRLANPDVLLTGVAAERTASGADGAEWLGGALTVSALPVMYSGGEVGRVSFHLEPPGLEQLVEVDASPPFSATFPQEALAGVVAPALRFQVVSTRADGGIGPQVDSTAAVRYDARAPEPGTLRQREWIGAAFRFVDLYDTTGEADEGVGRTTVALFAGGPDASAETIVASGQRVTTGSDLTESGAQAYRLAAAVCDALSNCVAIQGGRFGVDLTPPAITGTTVVNRAVNPGSDMGVILQEDRSGLAARPLEVSTRVRAPGSTTPACGPTVEGEDLPGRSVNGSCVPDTIGGTIVVPRNASGYYTYTIAPLDRAGNRGEPITRTVLVDRVAPTLSALSVPQRFTASTPAVLGFTAADDLELQEVNAFLIYPAPNGERLALPFAAPLTFGAPFDDQLTASATAEYRLPVVRTLTYTGGSSRTTALVDSAAVLLRDAARNTAIRAIAIPPSALDSTSTSDPFTAVQSLTASTNRTAICAIRCLETDPRTLTLTVAASGRSGFSSPFAEVLFYVQRVGSRFPVLVGDDLDPSVTDVSSTSTRTYTYSAELTPPTVPGEYDVFAVGVSAGGNGLVTARTRIEVFAR